MELEQNTTHFWKLPVNYFKTTRNLWKDQFEKSLSGSLSSALNKRKQKQKKNYKLKHLKNIK